MAKKQSNPVGRPSRYDSEVHPGIVRKLASRGLTEEEMIEILEIGARTFYDWKTAHPEFSQAIAEGKENPIRDVEDALYRLCKGYTYEEMGQKRVKHPDVRAIQFYLKNVSPDKWRDKQEIEHSGSIGMDVEPKNLTREQIELLESIEGDNEPDG
jgi:hypothetical protein